MTGCDVDSRLFDGDSLEPIIMTREDGTKFHLGQVSSSIHWAVQDISDQDRTTKQELDSRYPDGFEFVFYYLPVELCNDKVPRWWTRLSIHEKREAILVTADKIAKLSDSQKERIRNSEETRVTAYQMLSMWIDNQMIHEAVKLKPINPGNIIIEPYIRSPRVRKVWKVELKINHGGISCEFGHEPSDWEVQEMVDSLREERQCHITDIIVTTKYKLT